nr:histone-lysine N-methyltransferase SUVR5 isoform X1 [Ipomoea trifida]
MEVLSHSGVHYVGESDCAQEDVGTSLVHGEEPNCVKLTAEVQTADLKVDGMVINVEGAQKETQDGVQWTVEAMQTSEEHFTANAYHEFEEDGPKLSSDSHDSEDENTEMQAHAAGPGLAVESSKPFLNANEGGNPNDNQEGETKLCEPPLLERDEPLAVWVKWRGKWQAGIKCARADWPLSTVRAKPTHDRKKYLVIFFPRTRNFSWADVLLVCPINEFPQPIAYKTHKVGAKMVNDLTLSHRFIMQKLAVGILNIFDQLHREALVETARNVMVWKEFAMEASRCKDYSDIGRMLLKFQDMILPHYKTSHWRENSLQSWVQQCQNANSAEAAEILKEELVDAILWNDINSLPSDSAHVELSIEWKTCKHEVMKWFSVSHPVSTSGDLQKSTSDSPLSVGLQQSKKRPKLEVRRADTNTSQVDSQGHEAITLIDSGFFNGRDTVDNAASLDSEHTKGDTSLGEAPPTGSPGSLNDRWGDIIVEPENSEVIHTKDVELTPAQGIVTTKSFDHSNKNRQCIAFIEAKGRQCVRWANDGDVYCCVHLASRFASNSSRAEATPPVEAGMCEGTTVLGTKCKHRSLHGSSFCKKHRPKGDTNLSFSSPENKLKRKHDDVFDVSQTTNCKDIVVADGYELPLDVDPISVIGGDSFKGNSLIRMPEYHMHEYNDTEFLCIGLWPQDGEPCLEGAKRHSLYCEKHLPSWLKRARDGKSRIISKEVFIELLKSCHSREQKLYLHQACELFYRLFKSVLSRRNPVPKEVQFQWAISEASKDARIREFLMKLVYSEKERLKRLWGFAFNENMQDFSSNTGSVPISVSNDNNEEDDDENVIRCKICSGTFLNDQALGRHWMDNHTKEAQWLFRGYVCAICLDSFTNKKVLESHVKERHHVEFVEQCMLFQCIPCSSHFGNQEQLWSHVLAVHPANFRSSNAPQHHNFSGSEDFNVEQSRPVPVENINSEGQSSVRKFICKFCGLKFDLLPDLGRHHQAAHMGPTSVSSRLSKRGIRFYAYKLKSGRLTRPKFKKSLASAASYRIRSRSAQNMKKRIQSSNLVGTGELGARSSVLEASSPDKLVDNQCLAIAKILFTETKKTKPRPNNSDILSVARSVCCRVSLKASLEANYGSLPERIYLKAAKLCSEQNILVNWHLDGFICPNGCGPFVDPHMPPLVPLPNCLNRPRYSTPNAVVSEWKLDESHYVIDSEQIRHEPSDRTIILCDDISFGQESVPITCVMEDNLLGSLHILPDDSDGQITANSLPWDSFSYITKPLLDQSLQLDIDSSQLGCSCPSSMCSSQTCDHVYLFDNDYEDAKDIYGQPMHGRFPYDERGRIILEEGYLVYECNQWCCCDKSCKNRVLQNGVKVKLEIFKTDTKGWAVRAREAILRGTFVCEFIGEVIDEQEANRRRSRYGREGCAYLLEIDTHINDMSRLVEGQSPYVIDATNYGNISRYINHSCSPNLVNHQVLVESMDYQLAHIGLYAGRDILAGEELTFDYRYKPLPGEGIPCLCGSSNCRGRLY